MTTPSRAFFVLGPESSGTRLVTRLLIAAGCHGSSDHVQPLDDSQFNLKSIPISTPVVWRRSIPHNNEIPKISAMIDRVHPRTTMAIVTVRDWYCIVQSQLRDNQHATSLDQANYNIFHAYELIFTKLSYWKIPYRIFVYEAAVLNPEMAQSRFLESLGLPALSKPVEIHNGNDKYWSANQDNQW